MKHIKNFAFTLLITLCALLGTQQAAHAACTNPAGVEGNQVYNSTHKVMQFCDGTSWRAMIGGGSGGADDLGNHTATTNLDMGTNKLLNIGGGDASLVNGSGYAVFGAETGVNIVIDNNEIMARNNGATTSLYLQNDGGNLQLGYANPGASNLDVNGGKIIDLADPTAATDAATKAYVDANAGSDNLGAGGTTTGSLFSTNASRTIGRDTNDFIRFDDNAQAFWQINGVWEYQFYPTNLSAYTNNANDLGTSAKRWRDGWFAGAVTAGSFAGNGAAITAIAGDNITDNTIDGSEIQNESITSADIDNGTIATADLANGSVTNAKIVSMSDTKLTGIPTCNASNQALQWNGSSFTCRTLSFAAPHSHHTHSSGSGSGRDRDEAREDLPWADWNNNELLGTIDRMRDAGKLF